MSVRKSLLSSFALTALLLLSPVSEAASGKIGFVNVAEIMAKAPQAEAARAELQKEFKPREEKLGQLRDEIQKEEADLKRNAAAMSAERKKQAEISLQKKENDFNRELSSFREDFGVKRNQVLQALQKKISQVILGIAKKGDYDMILSDGVVYVSDKINLTDKVLAELKKSAK
ncbi:OmpH family outer membrane protein [Acidihalobacter prosperus]|uniref:Outer membrane protein H n=1 Tax=Acidihalobacter prosperus TaxID=160660 RepID=A0A1A6C8Z6_9GAMM|nr:OmpH family outer membrane protein [Acidihalobacter prosperus]OBS11036.1 hypothetical protein Thpro_020752 [Acidihalobacter prosperus]